MVAGTIIGASIFVQPSEIAASVPSALGVTLVWIVSGLLTLSGALVCASYARLFPDSGGVYIFLRRAFSPLVGFLWGWAMFWTMHSGIIAAIAVIFARYLSYFVPLGPAGLKLTALGVVLVLSAVNYRGVGPASNLQALFTAGKVAAIGLIIMAGLLWGSRAAATALPAGRIEASGFLLAVAGGLFAFGGWHMVTYNAGETIAPRRTIPRALLGGVFLVTASYIALNGVYFYLLPLQTVVSSHRVAADAADALLGSGGAAVMSALVVFSTFGALSGIILAGPRVYFAMARDGLLFAWLGTVHPRYRTPHRAILLQALWASVLVVTGTYRLLFSRVVYTEWIFFGLLALGLLRICRGSLSRKMIVNSILFAFSAFAVVVNQVLDDSTQSLLGLGFVAAGSPVYYLWARRRKGLETEAGRESDVHR